MDDILGKATNPAIQEWLDKIEKFKGQILQSKNLAKETNEFFGDLRAWLGDVDDEFIDSIDKVRRAQQDIIQDTADAIEEVVDFSSDAHLRLRLLLFVEDLRWKKVSGTSIRGIAVQVICTNSR